MKRERNKLSGEVPYIEQYGTEEQISQSIFKIELDLETARMWSSMVVKREK